MLRLLPDKLFARLIFYHILLLTRVSFVFKWGDKLCRNYANIWKCPSHCPLGCWQQKWPTMTATQTHFKDNTAYA